MKHQEKGEGRGEREADGALLEFRNQELLVRSYHHKQQLAFIFQKKSS